MTRLIRQMRTIVGATCYALLFAAICHASTLFFIANDGTIDAHTRLPVPTRLYSIDSRSGHLALVGVFDSTFAFGCGVIPDSLLMGIGPQHWCLAQTNSRTKIINSWSESLVDTSTVFLVCDKNVGVWLRTEVPGTETRPKLLNGWIFGQLADTDPHTDYSRHLGFVPLERDSAFVIFPLSKDTRLYHLGPKSQVLWIDNDSTMTYRVDDSLFEAKLGAGSLNRQLLTVAHELRGVQWAFRGGGR